MEEKKHTIKIFKTFEEQEMYFLKYFAELSPSERLQALSKLQKKNNKNVFKKPQKKITLRKHFIYGY
jgi:hypothetical protein